MEAERDKSREVTEMKHFEDMEFQQLEKKSNQAEEKESQNQQLLQEIAEYQHNLLTRKVCLWEWEFVYVLSVVCVYHENTKTLVMYCTGVEELKLNHNIFLIYKQNVYLLKERLMGLKKQSTRITQQAQQEKENFLKEKNNLHLILQRVNVCLCLGGLVEGM